MTKSKSTDIVDAAVKELDIQSLNIQSHYILVDIGVSVWGANKSDKEVARKAEEDNASIRKGSYVKSLVRKSRQHHTTLSRLSGLKATTDGWFKSITTPWDDTGRRALSVRRLEAFMVEFNERRDLFYRLLDQFLDGEYVKEIEIAKEDLGRIFNSDDYPSVDSLKRKFHFDYTTEAIQGPEALTHFSTVLSEETTKRIATAVGESIQNKLMNSYEAELKRMMEEMINFRLNLDDAKYCIKERTWEKIGEYLDRIPDLNITQAPLLNESAKKLEEAMSKTDAQGVRDNYSEAGELAAVVDTVLETIDAEINNLFG